MTDMVAQWSDFNVAMTGASAALAGLVIVAASVNIGTIIRAGTLTARLAAAVAALVLALVVSAAGLIPGMSSISYGLVIIIAAVGAGVFQSHATWIILRDPDQAQGGRISKSTLGFLPVVAYLVSGIMMVSGQPSSLLFAAAGGILAIVSGILVSWIVLVEVLR
ncbi:hypothetical protein [Enteractinococcus coprophilus]|uniref:Uncharacterized protein n=1 Tax=Enteractinococcus coprophilus TaxID=1027633 RepID=A0A543A0B1_9MICC|nr:hypothetical protein [Enteractinococcus coprophilus]TQL66024.1 hypothetical protein FB556_2503 [Enteractinococcus coprophilus]